MEAAGLASSIISILDLTAKIVVRTREYMINVKKSPAFLQNIENQMPLLAKCLEGIKRQALTLKITNEVAFELGYVVDHAFDELLKIDQYVRMLKPTDRSTSLARFDRAVKSVLKYDAKIASSMEKLRGYLDTLTLFQSSISAGKTDEIIKELRTLKREQTETFTQAQIDSVKQWIGGATRDEYYDNIMSRKAPGTCEWIYNTPEYIQWRMDLTSGKPKVLWVHGPPGFGKTFVSATILSRLIATAEPSAAVFWTSEGKFANSSLTDIPRSWIAQLLAQDATMCERLDDIRSRSTTDTANEKELWQCLQTLLRAFRFPVTLVIDGLDEYQQQQAQRQEQLARSREASLKYSSIRDFLKELKASIKTIACRLVCVSQQEAEIQAELSQDVLTLERIQSFEHNITKQDVEQDVKAYATFMIGDKLPKKSPALKADLAGLVASKAEGQMLWISLLQRDTTFLRPSFSDKKLRSIVENTPPGLDHVYHANLRSISALSEGDKARALRFLYWIMHALRPLTVHELVEAILIEPDEDESGQDDDFPDDDLPEHPDEEDVFGEIKTLCGSFVTFDIDETKKTPRNWKIRFSHSSIRAFLIKNLPTDIYNTSQEVQADQGAGDILGSLCLRYLSFQNVWPAQVEGADEGVLCLSEHPFLTYAATYWPLHLTEHNRALMEPLTSSFFRLHYESFSKWQSVNLNIRDVTQAGLAEKTQWSHKSRLSFAASLGLTSIVKDLCELGDEVNPDGASPLCAACTSGSMPTIQILLNHGALLEKPMSGGWMPIHRAARLGKIDVVKMLISKGVDVNAKSDNSWTATHCAAFGGHEDVLNVLMAAGSDMLSLDSSGWHALYHAIRQNHAKAAKIIMNSTKDVVDKMVNHASYIGWTPLAAAAFVGDKDIAEILVKNGADSLQICEEGGTPLFYSAREGHLDVFQLLLSACDNVTDVVNKVTESYGRSLLHAAVLGKNIEIVRILLDNGADVTRHDNGYLTALDWAVYGGSKDIVDLLIENSSATPAFKFWNPLMDAAEAGHAEMVQLLLDKGLDVNAVTALNWSALMVASRWGHANIVGLLLNHPDGKKLINDEDESGYTSLLYACQYGHASVVKLLMDADADYTYTREEDGISCLDAAASSGNVSTVSILLEKCGSTAFSDKYVLHSAADSGKNKMFDLLRTYYKLNLGVTEDGRTLLHCAAKGGNVDIINTVLAEGSSDLIARQDHRGVRSLYDACQSGNIDAIKLILQKYSEYTPPLKIDFDDVFTSIYGGNLDVIKLLYHSDPVVFDNACRGRWTLLYVACRRGWDVVIDFLLEKGFNVTDLNKEHESCLHAYGYNGKAKTPKLFNQIDWKEALEVRDTGGRTPLLAACRVGSASAFRRFAQQGAQINDVNNRSWSLAYLFARGRTSSHYAAWSGSVGIIKLIVEAYGIGVLVASTPLNVYPIHEAVAHDFMIEYLLEHGADLGVENIYGQSPLFKAIADGENASLAVLLRHGAGAIERRKASQLMAYAACTSYFPSLKLLHTDGFKLDSGLTDGQTLLHIAASNGAEENIEFLIEQGFDWDAIDDHGWTATDCSLVSEKVPGRDAPAEEIRKLDLPYLPPTGWAIDNSEAAVFKPGLETSQIVLNVGASGPEEPPQVFTLTADHYLLPTPTQSYFEITIDQCPPTNAIAIGVDVFVGEHHRPLGVGFPSAALFGEDGSFYYTGFYSCKYTSSFGQGDTIGCGIDYVSQKIFYTKNGKCLGTAYDGIKGRFVPAVCTMETTFAATGNFGQQAFLFDIESHGYGDKSCHECYGEGRYINFWHNREWYTSEDEDDEDIAYE